MSIADQHKIFRKYYSEKGYKIVEEFIDEGFGDNFWKTPRSNAVFPKAAVGELIHSAQCLPIVHILANASTAERGQNKLKKRLYAKMHMNRSYQKTFLTGFKFRCTLASPEDAAVYALRKMDDILPGGSLGSCAGQ